MRAGYLRLLAAAGVLCALAATGGCATFASFQTADTQPKGKLKLGVGATVSDISTTVNGTATTAIIPAVDIWGRYGITDKLEVHGLVWIPLGETIGAKYQLLGSSTKAGFSLSLGLDLGYLQISSGTGANEVKSSILDTYVPVYLGYRFSPGAAMYLTPKYLLRLGFGGGGTGVDNEVGGTIGVALGQKTAFLLEGTVVYDLNAGLPSFTGGLGVAF